MRNKRFVFILILLAGLVSLAATAAPPLKFDNQTQELRFNALVAELRCLVCQNQNLADSDAELAQDLRRVILEQMQTGQSDRQIKQFLVERYGEFILYRPPLEKATLVLWLGPLVILLFGAIAVVLNIRKRAKQFNDERNEQGTGT